MSNARAVAFVAALSMTVSVVGTVGCSKEKMGPATPNRAVTSEQMDRVTGNMTMEEVEAILDEGRAPDRSVDWPRKGEFIRIWGDGTKEIKVTFRDGKVVGIYRGPTTGR